MSMEGATGAYTDPGQEVSINGNIDPLADRYWDPRVIAADELVDMSLYVEEEAWILSREKFARRAGAQATWEGRRGISDQHGHDEREVDFRGRYEGPARISPRVIAAAEGEDVAAILP